MVQKEQRIKSIKDRIYHAKRLQYSYNREKGNSILAHVDQIRPQGEYEEQNEEEISTIPSVNNLLEQPLQNETSKDEIMHDHVGQSEFENSDEDQIMKEDNLDYGSVQDRSRSLRKRNTRERRGEKSNPENETITRKSRRPTKVIRPPTFQGDVAILEN